MHPRHLNIEKRFYLRLNPSGEWRLSTPAGIDQPATIFEISVWLDIGTG